MTTENLIELFEKGLEYGKYFKAETRPTVGRFMEFGFDVTQKFNANKRLGSISIKCEFDDCDYYENNLDKHSFGVFHYIIYNSGITGIKAFKFIISPETFLRLLKRFRPFEREANSQIQIEKKFEFDKEIDAIEEDYDIEVSALQRKVLIEKTINK